MKRAKVEPIPKERLEAAARRLQTKVAEALHDAYIERARDWGMSKLALAQRAGHPQALLVRTMNPEGLTGLGMLGMVAEACDAEIEFNLIDLTKLKPKGEE